MLFPPFHRVITIFKLDITQRPIYIAWRRPESGRLSNNEDRRGMSTTLSYLLFAIVPLLALASHVRQMRDKEPRTLASSEKGKLFLEGWRAQHPHIDLNWCIASGGGTEVCPEGDVLAVMAALGDGSKAIVALKSGHRESKDTLGLARGNELERSGVAVGYVI